MNTEQERADFEAECKFRMIPTERNGSGEYTDLFAFAGWRFWQARAALQSQDREGMAALLAALEESSQSMKAILAQERIKAVAKRVLSRSIGMADKAIDHARRIEGEGE